MWKLVVIVVIGTGSLLSCSSKENMARALRDFLLLVVPSQARKRLKYLVIRKAAMCSTRIVSSTVI